MIAQDGIAAADAPATPVRSFARDIAGRVSSRSLVYAAITALVGTWAIARFAPGAWLGGLLAYSIAAAALTALTDRRVAIVRARTGVRERGALVPLRIIRFFVTGVAVASAIVFVLFGLGALVGSIAVGG